MKETKLDILDTFGTKYVPQEVLVFYSSDDGRNQNYLSSERVYIEHHAVRSGKLEAGKPITRKFIHDLALLSQEQNNLATATIENLMPECVLFHDTRPGRNVVAWHQKPQVIILRLQGNKADRTYKVPMPDMLFCANGPSLHVYAMKTLGKRPTIATPLFRAPVWNTYDEGGVCMGNVEHPEEVEDIQDFIDEYTRAFWAGIFTHASGKPTKTPIPKLYLKLKGKKSFPLTELIPSKPAGTIKHLLTQL